MNDLFTRRVSGIRSKFSALTFALVASMYSFAAFAQSADPSATIVSEIDKGKTYGIAAAVAFAVAVWAIRAVGMARRKG